MKHIRNKLPWHHRHQLEETYLKERKEKLNDKNLKNTKKKTYTSTGNSTLTELQDQISKRTTEKHATKQIQSKNKKMEKKQKK